MSHPGSSSDCDGNSSHRGELFVYVMRLMADYTIQTLEELSELQNSSPQVLSTPQMESGHEGKAAPSRTSDEGITLALGDMVEYGSDEIRELAFRTKRIKRVVGLVEQWARRQQERTRHRGQQSHRSDPTNTSCNEEILGFKSQDENGSRSAGSSGFTVRAHSTVAIRAIESLHDCLVRINTTEARPVEITCTGESSSMIQPIARSRGLMEASTELYSTNVRMMFRKMSKSATKLKIHSPSASTTHSIDGLERTLEGQKRPRSSDDGKEPELSSTTIGNALSSVFDEISSSQREQRLSLYAGRVPLLPKLDTFAMGIASNSSSFIYLSPAIRRYAALNLSAERQMLQRVWRVTCKAQVLLQLPRLHQAEEAYHEQLRNLSSRQGDSSGKALRDLAQHRYFRFVHVNEGVIRVDVQHGLLIDFTYNCAGGQWVVLKLHWNIWVPTASLWFSSSFSPNTTEDSARKRLPFKTPAGIFDGGAHVADSGIRVVLPQRQDVMLRFIQKNFTNGGLEGGLLAANHLLCTVVMDTLAKQAKQLQEHFFVSLLKACFIVDIRPGSHLAVQLRLPIADHQTQSDGGNASAVFVNLHKFYLTAGTVLVESTLTSRRTAVHEGLNTQLLLSNASLVDGNRLLVNLEQWLWEGVFATDNVDRAALH
ncbi:unnamed protein product [Phytomonas sp. Hart1]|nr:unnamed protein product [Phytomonas sp. Hart1]|eukprot:CCW67721.1 unnamed protein product [Phytomonas sp. isolate Hart1]